MLNGRVLELGCGELVTAGWERLDSRDLAGVNHVQSATDLSNFGNGTFVLVVAKDLIEHLSWRAVPKALAEWRRVLAPGGCLEVETPNALELAEILRGRAAGQRWQGESDWGMFCRIAYGHQDYPENYHACYFTPGWLTELLLAAGFAKVTSMRESLQRFRLAAWV